MAFFTKQKWPLLILAAYLGFAIMGAFTLDYTSDSLAKSETVMSQAGEYSFSPLRTGSPRIFMAGGLQHTGALLSQSSLGKSEKVNYFNIKNTILLKLRI